METCSNSETKDNSEHDKNNGRIHLEYVLYFGASLYGEEILHTVKARHTHLKTRELQTFWKPGSGFDIKLWEVPELEDEEIANKIELLYADLPVIARYWRQMPNLKWVHTGWNGVDGLMSSLNKDEPLPTFMLTKTKGAINAPLITEYVIGHIIATERCFLEAKEAQKRGEWKQMIFSKSRSLTTITVGILGVGDIGRYLAKACKALGMTVWGLTRRQRTEEKDEDIDVYRTMEGLPDLLQHCDYICNVLPSTHQTKYLLSGDMLSHCKGSVFINVGRGDVVDEDSLVKALRNGWLRGAVLDVFEVEPLPATSPLWSMPEVVITPHVSGWSSGEKHMRKVNECFFTNYERYISGKPLDGVLDWSQGY